MSGGVAGAQIKVDAYLGATPFCRFPIDLSTELTFLARVERRQPQPVLTMLDVDPLPEFTLYPLPDQAADKVCAMYELYGNVGRPSSRFRDLVDLALIAVNLELEAGPTVAALAAESRRRGMSLPARIENPGPTWAAGYRAVARSTSLGDRLHDLSAGLRAAGDCFDPLLAGDVDTGVWTPGEQRWSRPATDGEAPG